MKTLLVRTISQWSAWLAKHHASEAECAMFLAGLIAQRDPSPRDMLDPYELYIYKQWLRVYMRSKMIKHNKDLFECVDDKFALLNRLHIY